MRWLVICALFFLAAGRAVCAEDADVGDYPDTPPAEFGDSVEFDKTFPPVRLEMLRRKAVLILGVRRSGAQEREWAAEAIAQIQEAYGARCEAMLIFLKTDGGGVAGALEYARELKLNPELWAVGADENGAWFRSAGRKVSDGAWRYILLDAWGHPVRMGDVGRRLDDGPKAGKFALAQLDLKEVFGRVGSYITGEYPATMQKVIHLTNFGHFAEAAKMAQASRKKDGKLKSLQMEINRAADKYMQMLIEMIEQEGEEPDFGLRYDSWKALTVLLKDFKKLPSSQEAAALAGRVAKQPQMQREQKAEQAYQAVVAALTKADDAEARKAIFAGFGRVAQEHKETRYGKLAQIALEESSGQ